MFFWEKDRKLLQNINDRIIRIEERQDSFTDKTHCTKNVWKQRAMNIMLVVLVAIVAYNPVFAKELLKEIFKLLGG